MSQNKYSQLFQRIGYQFDDDILLTSALTHRSASAQNNERLEFLGDSILNFTAAEALYQKFGHASEGDLSRLRAQLVKGETLAEIAHEMEISEFLVIGEGERKSGGSSRPSILADCMEAIIGAIYLDADMDQAKSCILRWYTSRLKTLSLVSSGKDPKSQLQEWLQARKRPLPVYSVTKIDGESHCQTFTVQCKTDLLTEVVYATGSSRRQAEKDAAVEMLTRLQEVYE